MTTARKKSAPSLNPLQGTHDNPYPPRDQGAGSSSPPRIARPSGSSLGDRMTISFVDGGLRITTQEQALAWLQEEVRRHARPGVSPSEELIAERRREAARE